LSRFSLAALTLALIGSAPVSGRDPSFLILSDVHFNPLADPAAGRELAAADVSNWESILSRASSQAISKPGEDTNWPLLRSVLQQSAKLPGKPEFVLITGDLFAHHLREAYARDISASPDFARFAQKTALFLEREFKAALPSIPVVMALGNNDGDCANVDYSIQPGGPFLQKTLPAIADGAGVPTADLEDGWTSLGSYDIAHPKLKRSRIIVLNTTFLSWRYQNTCGDQSDDPGARLLAWLAKRLQSAQDHKEKVWLVYHIPPGIDAFASTHPRPPNTERVVSMWNLRYQAEFEKILLRYAATLQNQISGHTHFDDFRLLGGPEAPSSFVLLNPGVSPNVRQNPALREASFRRDGTLTDLKTWYLPLADQTPEWKLGYQFRREWKLKAVDLPSLTKLYSQILESPDVRAKWQEIYSVWSLDKKGMTERDFAATSCATGNAEPENFRKCFCARTPDAAFCR